MNEINLELSKLDEYNKSSLVEYLETLENSLFKIESKHLTKLIEIIKRWEYPEGLLGNKGYEKLRASVSRALLNLHPDMVLVYLDKNIDSDETLNHADILGKNELLNILLDHINNEQSAINSKIKMLNKNKYNNSPNLILQNDISNHTKTIDGFKVKCVDLYSLYDLSEFLQDSEKVNETTRSLIDDVIKKSLENDKPKDIIFNIASNVKLISFASKEALDTLAKELKKICATEEYNEALKYFKLDTSSTRNDLTKERVTRLNKNHPDKDKEQKGNREIEGINRQFNLLKPVFIIQEALNEQLQSKVFLISEPFSYKKGVEDLIFKKRFYDNSPQEWNIGSSDDESEESVSKKEYTSARPFT